MGWPKGVPRSPETIAKRTKTLKENIANGITKVNHWTQRGIPRSSEVCAKISASKRGKDKAFKNNPDEQSGYRYFDWTAAVKKRDNYACQHCGTKSKLEAHHIKDWENFPEFRFDVDNGLTLCKSCHRKEEIRLMKL